MLNHMEKSHALTYILLTTSESKAWGQAIAKLNNIAT